MLSKEELVSQKARFSSLLAGTEREGISKVIDYLNTEGFFEAPASTGFHGSYVGGLAMHSLAVYDKLVKLVDQLKPQTDFSRGQKPLPITKDTLIIAALLHDVCKVGAYVRTKADDGWTNKKDKDKGHAALSISRIAEFITLDPLEEMMIRFHMGIYHAIEYDGKAGEYHLLAQDPDAPKEERYGKSYRNVLYHNPIAKIMSIADELVTMEEKIKEE
jgi:23S rRNA maturation-related 3'-5' exoribonuclease YhaM